MVFPFPNKRFSRNKSPEIGRAYCYGFNGKDRESEFSSGAYDFGARIHDARLGRWMSVDPKCDIFPSESTYSVIRNSPTSCIDVDGMKWVNYYDNLIQEKQKALLENPNSKKLKRQINRLEKKQAEVNEMIQDIKLNDIALYNYIENLTVADPKTDEKLDVQVIVKIGNSSDAPRMNASSLPADGATRYKNKDGKNKFRMVEYDCLESENVKWTDGNASIIPAPILPDSDIIGFEITIYAPVAARTAALANEVGDVMFRMEYPDASLKEGSNNGLSDSAYRNSGSGDYSFNVEDKFKERKKSGDGKDSNNNPYPLRTQTK